MKFRKRLLSVVWSLCMLVGFVSYSEAMDYTYNADWFNVQGNLPGNGFDAFSDAVIYPWSIWDGTAIESGGFLTLKNPGDLMEPIRLPNIICQEERSSIADNGMFRVTGNAGNFMATSRWMAQLPQLNSFYGMELWSRSVDGKEDISFNLYNFDAKLAEALGVSSGLGVWFIKNSQIQSVAINQANIAGGILFSLAFDDSSNQLYGFFSLDGGTTYQSPFLPFSSSLDSVSETNWLLEAEAISYTPVPVPATVWLLGSALMGLLGFKSRLRSMKNG